MIGDDGEDDDISEEELAKLEQELAEALEDDDLLVALGSAALGGIINEDEDEEGGEEEGEVDEDIDVTNNKDDEEEEVDKDIDVTNDKDGDEVDDDNEEEEMTVKLKNWQLRRLAYALKDGRRKTSVSLFLCGINVLWFSLFFLYAAYSPWLVFTRLFWIWNHEKRTALI